MTLPEGRATGVPYRWLELTDEELLRQSAVHLYRASGPGGQKRNKTDSAVRLHHEPTGLIVTAVESRSQHENRARALKRLRIALALQLRQPVPETGMPAELAPYCRDGVLHVEARHPRFLAIMGTVLDVLDAGGGKAAPTATRLGLSTSGLIRLLYERTEAWQIAQEIRTRHGERPLNSPRA